MLVSPDYLPSPSRDPKRVSVVIPVYNGAWCIERAVNSVLAQRQPPLEIIVVNDGSQDNSAALLNQYGNQIRVIHKANQGLSAARNTGIRAAHGDYIAFLDADDYWLEDKLAAQIALFNAQPNLAFCGCAAKVVDQHDNQLQLWPCPRLSPEQNILAAIFAQLGLVPGSGSGVMAPTHLLLQQGGFDPDLKALEDVDMWLRLASLGPFDCVSEPQVVILRHSDSMSTSLSLMRQHAIKVMQKNRHLLPAHLQGRYWQQCYAGMLIDYAKWAYRARLEPQARTDLLHALRLAPLRYGKLIASLFLAMRAHKPI
ncbi:glycosyltransferase family 2 protein [Motilimonas sp. KMU-193]|uniref:glycosyltransferase family 2 protein n=1 Tax=Motilimonas sp. KMU-193 TaxID=3388668 RepID=UPI00396B2A12